MLSELSAQLKSEIDAASEEKEDPRWHLGASQIGAECIRKIWLSFRWVKHERVNGRKARLFLRGHNEERRIVELLRATGFEVSPHDPATGNQWRFSILGGHYGGSSDGKCRHGAYFDNRWLQLECKTHNKQSFSDLVKNGVKKSKPQHYAQMCVYGKAFGLDMGLYFAVCKDDDDLHIEFVELDNEAANNAERIAEYVINSQTMPTGVSKKGTHFVCKMCHFHAVCHSGQSADHNCRSCRFARPSDEGEAAWVCERWNIPIPREHAGKGCGEWSSII